MSPLVTVKWSSSPGVEVFLICPSCRSSVCNTGGARTAVAVGATAKTAQFNFLLRKVLLIHRSDDSRWHSCEPVARHGPGAPAAQHGCACRVGVSSVETLVRWQQGTRVPIVHHRCGRRVGLALVRPQWGTRVLVDGVSGAGTLRSHVLS